MARLYPNDAFEIDSDGQHQDELVTLRHLGEMLPDDYSVFHSLHWSHAGKNSVRFGEIDFVVVNRSGDVLVIEQKNGSLEETEEGLVKCYGPDRKVLSSQIQRNIGNIRDKFKKQHGRDATLDFDYLIYCPDYRVVSVNAAGVDACRLVDKASKGELAERIQRLLGPGSSVDVGLTDRVLNFFAHKFHVAPDIGTFVQAQRQNYIRMLEGLGEVIDKLEFTPFRLRVVGTAGCGKTQLTLRQAAAFVGDGRRVLQLCFNRPLADKLRRLAPDGVHVDTYYGFCQTTLKSLGYEVNDTSFSDPDYWHGVQERLMVADIPDDVRYDALIVDEGQDFLQEWWEILELFLKDDASVVWLEDPLQNLRQTSEIALPGFVTYRETANFRTPISIARFIQGVLDVEFAQKNPLPGLGARVEGVKDRAALVKQLAHRINELVKLGFRKEEIAIVSCRGMQSSSLGNVDQIGSHTLRRFAGEYCDGAQVYTEGDVHFDSIHRFKGQQSPAVILIDLDERLDRSERSRHILYCAMTRATVRLEVLASEGSPWFDDLRANI